MNEQQEQHIVVHLINGQTVVARYRGQNDEVLGLDKPHELIALPQGPGQPTGVLLNPYLSHHKVLPVLDEFDMPHSMILMVREAPEALRNAFVHKTSGIEIARTAPQAPTQKSSLILGA